MPKICWYLQLHQPYRLRNFEVFEIGVSDRSKVSYFSGDEPDGNDTIFNKVAQKSYLPMLQLLHQLQAQPGFKISLSGSGVFWEQALALQPEIVRLVQQLVRSYRTELLGETYYHSLAGLYDHDEFVEQVQAHRRLIKRLFGYRPTVFRNTELIYSNKMAEFVQELGFMGTLTEGVDRYLEGRTRTQPFKSVANLPLLLKHAQLSDDIAFRYSDRNWSQFPLRPDRYHEWLRQYPDEAVINLFMDFETFGEHQWEADGIFEFVSDFVARVLADPHCSFVTPTEVLSQSKQVSESTEFPIYNVPEPISWADVDRDLTAWTANQLQQDTLRQVYELGPRIKAINIPALTELWRRLQTSDHFYYMCTKWSQDGDVHAYFSPYQDPYEAYRRFAVVLSDLTHRVIAVERLKHTPSMGKHS